MMTQSTPTRDDADQHQFLASTPASASAGSEEPTPQSSQATEDTDQSPNNTGSVQQSTTQNLEDVDDGDESATTEDGNSEGDGEYLPSRKPTSASKRRSRPNQKRAGNSETITLPSAKRQRRGQTTAKTAKDTPVDKEVGEPVETETYCQQLKKLCRLRGVRIERQEKTIAEKTQAVDNLVLAREQADTKLKSLKWKYKNSERIRLHAEDYAKVLSKQLDETQEKCRQWEKDFDEQRQSLNRVLDENFDLRDLPVNKVDDGEILGPWEIMICHIQQACTNLYLTEKPTEDTAVPPCREREEAMKLLRTYKEMPEFTIDCIFERYVWKYLCHSVFTFKGGIWAGELGEQFALSIKSLTKEAKDNVELLEMLSRMKSKFAMAMDEKYKVDQEALEAHVQDCCTGLWMFVTPDKPDREGFTRKLRNAFAIAVKLQITFLKSRAHFQMFRHREGDFIEWARPANSCAKVTGFGPNPIVRSHIGPGLFKTGTADGRDFHKSMVLVQAIVDFRRRVPLAKE